MNEKQLWGSYGETQKADCVEIGPHSSYQYLNSRRHLLFAISRYKFAMKMIGDHKTILDLGCNDGLGAWFLAEFAQKVVGVDFDESAMNWLHQQKSANPEKIEFIHDDFLGKDYGKFDAVVSFDVLEHIYPKNEDLFMQTVIKNLNATGILIIGSPSVEANKYSKENIAGAHVNLHTGESLKLMLERYFSNVFMFTQNDEIIHTGHFRMANYLLAVCATIKK